MPAALPVPPLGPLRFQPVFKDYVWGGRNLARLAGRSLPEGPVAESWEISDHPNGETPILDGAGSSLTLKALLARHGTALLGERNAAALARGRFPLLIKLLDADDWLSVQVHPDDEFALAHEGSQGKTEMWVVLHADPGSEIILGLDRPTDPGELATALEAGTLEEFLHRVPARAGDAFLVPAGTVHAIGPGLVLAEIQQTSDVTYRMFDWNRVDAGGDGRELHVGRSLEVIDLSAIRPGPIRPIELATGHELLAECSYFRTERLVLEGSPFRGRCTGATFEIWGLLEGSARLDCFDGSSGMQAISWLLLPASLGDFEIHADARSVLLRISTPEPRS